MGKSQEPLVNNKDDVTDDVSETGKFVASSQISDPNRIRMLKLMMNEMKRSPKLIKAIRPEIMLMVHKFPVFRESKKETVVRPEFR